MKVFTDLAFFTVVLPDGEAYFLLGVWGIKSNNWKDEIRRVGDGYPGYCQGDIWACFLLELGARGVKAKNGIDVDRWHEEAEVVKFLEGFVLCRQMEVTMTEGMTGLKRLGRSLREQR